ncbi:MAG: pentapeptide repeat-containing protein [Gammaproteobacteria bacterium]
MTSGHLWYIRRGAQRRGPFPIAVIERNIGLGRIVASDSLSTDGENWRPATEFPDFELHRAIRERGDGARLDERQHERRRSEEQGSAATGSRRTGDRRRPEDPEVVARRERSYRVWTSLHAGSRTPSLFYPLLTLGAVALLATAWWTRPSPLQGTAACAAPPANGVNWESCDKRGGVLDGSSLNNAHLRNTVFASASLRAARLQGAQLAYADLTNADLRDADLAGADLRGATLVGANLAGANLANSVLEFADLTGARLGATHFAGARLAGTRWVDGMTCRKGSTGACRVSGQGTLTPADRAPLAR